MSFVEASYREATSEAARGLEGEQSGVSLVIYILAVALLTYGRLGVVGDLLGNAPPPRSRARALLSSVDALMPPEAALDTKSDPQRSLAWISQHREQLAWSDALGRFELLPQGEPRPAQ